MGISRRDSRTLPERRRARLGLSLEKEFRSTNRETPTAFALGRCPAGRIGPAPLAADDADAAAGKPVAIVSIASYERLMADVEFIGSLVGNPDLDKNIEGAIQLFTQGQGLTGLDKKRPLGRDADYGRPAVPAAAVDSGHRSEAATRMHWPD